MVLNRNKSYVDIIDFKHDFKGIDKEPEITRGFLYEFNFKLVDDTLTTDNVDELFDNLCLFSSLSRNNKYMVHFTGIPLEIRKTSFKCFKLIIGFTVKRTLTEVEKEVSRVILDFFEADVIALVSKRIVKNKNRVSLEDYFDNLNNYLDDEFPSYIIKQGIFP